MRDDISSSMAHWAFIAPQKSIDAKRRHTIFCAAFASGFGCIFFAIPTFIRCFIWSSCRPRDWVELTNPPGRSYDWFVLDL